MMSSRQIRWSAAAPPEPPQRLREHSVRRRWLAAGAALIIALAGTIAGVLLNRGPGVLLTTSFPRATRLVTNERAYASPHGVGIRTSKTWEVTSGSLFSRDGAGWTGIPDGVAPDATSSNATDSAVFRVITRRAGFADVTVRFDLKVMRLVTTPRTPSTSYDGVHVFLRYLSQRHLYVVSVFRRDGMVAIKEKLPGGPANGGSYHTLAESRHRIPVGRWMPVSVTIVTLASQKVRISLDIDSRPVLAVTQPRSGIPAILRSGHVGLRGDNCEFYFRDFTVAAASP